MNSTSVTHLTGHCLGNDTWREGNILYKIFTSLQPILPLTSIQCRSQELVELYLDSPSTPSRRHAQLKNHTGNLVSIMTRLRAGWSVFDPRQW